MAFVFVRLGTAAMLLAALGDHSYDFYTILRWVVCGVSAYGAFTEFERKRKAWGWAFAIAAVAFTPVAPVHLSRETWAPIDCLTAGIFAGSVLTTRGTKELPNYHAVVGQGLERALRRRG